MEKYFKNDYLNIFFLTLLWLIAVIIINPNGEFSYSDDFAYNGPVKRYLETGVFRITDWSSMTLVGHLWIGIVIDKLLGFSFSLNRMIVLFHLLAGSIITYYLVKEFIKNEYLIIVTTLCFMFNPVVIMHSVSFLTDIVFYFYYILSIFLFLKYFKLKKTKYLYHAILFNLYALLIRDVAFVVPIGVFVCTIISPELRKKFYNYLPLVLAIGVYLMWRYWLVNIHGLTGTMDYSRNRLFETLFNPIKFVRAYGQNLIYSIAFLSLYGASILVFTKIKSNKIITLLILLPLMIFTFVNSTAFEKTKYFLFETIAFVHLMPNVIEVEKSKFIPNEYVFVVLIFLSFLLFYTFLINIDFKAHIKNIRTIKIEYTFLLSMTFTYLAIMFSQNLFPKYLIPILPFVFIYFALLADTQKLSKVRITFSMFIILVVLIFSISCSYELMNQQRAVNEAISYLTENLKIPKNKIDGTFNYNAWNFYDYRFKSLKNKNWWWVKDDEYAVTYTRPTKRLTIKTFEYKRAFYPFDKHYVFVSKRTN